SDERGRHFKAERLRSLDINYQLVFRRHLHRQVTRLLALEDTVDVAGRAATWVDLIRPVGDQTTASDKVACEIDRGQSVAGCKCDDRIAMNERQCARRHDETSVCGARERANAAFNFAGVTHAKGA